MTKRLAFFIDSLEGGGAERVMLNLANQYVKHGYQVDLVLACLLYTSPSPRDRG